MGIILFFIIYSLVYLILLYLVGIFYENYYTEKKNDDLKQLV